MNKIVEAKESLRGLQEEAKKLGGKGGMELLLKASAADSLASKLDAQLGATVTDHAIYKSHTLK